MSLSEISIQEVMALEKLVNSDIVKRTYPMVDKIIVEYGGKTSTGVGNRLNLFVFLNDPNINRDNMYEKGFDPHYLIDYHIKNLVPYLGLDNPSILYSYDVFSPDGEKISSFMTT
jgi:hypothetical protein